MPLFLLFVILPILEIFLIIEVKEVIGGWNTLGLVILTAFMGSQLLRRQGWKTLQALQEKTGRGELPAQELVEAVLLFVGGALLLTPGFVTDAFGLACLLPPTRKAMARSVVAKGLVSANNQFFYYRSGGRTFDAESWQEAQPGRADQEPVQRSRESSTGEPKVLEGEFIPHDRD